MVMYGCESWTMKKAAHRRIDAFELWCWRRLLRVPWTARRSNQSILKDISPGISLEGMMLKLKLQYFGHLMWRVDSLEKTLMLGGIWGWRRRGREDEIAGWHHQLDGHGLGWIPGVGDGQGDLVCCNSWGHEELDMTERLDWTEHCWLKCQIVQPLWETVQRFLKNLNTELPYDPAILLLGIYPKELKKKKKNSNKNLYSYLHSIIIHNSQRAEAAQVFLSGQTNETCYTHVQWSIIHPSTGREFWQML